MNLPPLSPWQQRAYTQAADALAGGHFGHATLITGPARRWQRLLAEHLQRLALQAPVSELELAIDAIETLSAETASLLAPDAGSQHADGESLDELLTRLSVRLGKDAVRQAQPVADHRPEKQQCWRPWQDEAPSSAGAAPAPPEPAAQWPQPSWLLNPPLRLAALREQPLYQGPLTLLAGPQRIEAGWWDDELAARDYFIARDEGGALVWIYRTRLVAPGGWFLQGRFA